MARQQQRGGQRSQRPQPRHGAYEEPRTNWVPFVVIVVLVGVIVGVVLGLTHCGRTDATGGPAAVTTPAPEQPTVTEGNGGDGQGDAQDAEATREAAIKADPLVSLVNKNHAVPEGWTVTVTTLQNGRQVDERILPSLQQMMDELRALGYDPFVNSGYRSHEEQQSIWDQTIATYEAQGMSAEEAEAETLKTVARPGYSEHELGLACDICSEQFYEPANKPIQDWLTEHCWEYGWIRRYPEGKEDVTGVENEPWHYRYIGVDAAKDMHEKGIVTLEEYWGETA